MTRRLAGAAMSCLALLAGLWLILAPFALGIQPDNADWKDETLTDVWSGIGLGAFGLIGLIIFATALTTAIRARFTPARDAAPEPEETSASEATTPQTEPAAPPSDLDTLLAPLIAALTDDLARERDQEPPSRNGDSPRRPAEQPAAEAINRPEEVTR